MCVYACVMCTSSFYLFTVKWIRMNEFLFLHFYYFCFPFFLEKFFWSIGPCFLFLFFVVERIYSLYCWFNLKKEARSIRVGTTCSKHFDKHLDLDWKCFEWNWKISCSMFHCTNTMKIRVIYIDEASTLSSSSHAKRSLR